VKNQLKTRGAVSDLVSGRVNPLRHRFKSVARLAVRWPAWLLGQFLPLSARRNLVSLAGRRKLAVGLEFAMGMLDDLRRQDPVGFHRFLWSNHLAYARTYEIPRRFGASNINPTRHILFSRISDHLRSRGLDPHRDVRSVLDVGCSSGYLLRHLEELVFPSAAILHGLDIDAYAVKAGSTHLSSLRSRVKLFAADMEAAERTMSSQNYDLVLCCGVLMYVDETTAEKVVRAMFSCSAYLVGLICLAPPRDSLVRSQVRESDGAFIHDMDRMIRRTGGNIVSSTWIGTSTSGSSPCHVILAEPSAKPKCRAPARGVVHTVPGSTTTPPHR
jgi:SAM-dependent methyltransferase